MLQKGTVKWFSDKKGYGFITMEQASSDVFVHHSQIDMDGFRTLAEGDEVEFETQMGRKGLEAVRVRKL
jgi:CspA family cold shock protein